jgi:hypothetical protein
LVSLSFALFCFFSVSFSNGLLSWHHFTLFLFSSLLQIFHFTTMQRKNITKPLSLRYIAEMFSQLSLFYSIDPKSADIPLGDFISHTARGVQEA